MTKKKFFEMLESYGEHLCGIGTERGQKASGFSMEEREIFDIVLRIKGSLWAPIVKTVYSSIESEKGFAEFDKYKKWFGEYCDLNKK